MSQDRSPPENAWVIPKLWQSRAFILGGGPSLSKIDIERLRGRNVIAVNNAYRLANWIPFVYFLDRVWWNWHEEEVSQHPGIIVTQCVHLEKNKRVKWLKRGKRNEYDPRPGYMSYGGNSGHGAICLATALGAREIVLLGFDMHARRGHNWHQDHKRDVPADIYSNNFRKPMTILAQSLKDYDVRILNATPGSALDVFPIIDPEEVLP